jgi:putative drug exporter of the RND superfamily
VATLLYRLGKASYRNAGRVIIVWVVAMLAFLGTGVALGGQTEDTFEIPGSESQEAYNRLEAVFPTFAGASAQVVLVAPEGERLDSAQNRALMDVLAETIEEGEGIDNATTPFDEFAGDTLSEDGRYALIQVRYKMATPAVTDAMVEDLVSTRSIAEDAGLTVEYGGSIFQEQGVHLTISEVFGVIFAGIVLVITFRSFRPAWMPLASAIVGVGIAVGGILLVALDITVSSSAPLLAVMLGLAVGIDYSLFILSRHRNQLAQGEDPEESAATAVGTAGNAVVFAGVTVIIALLGLFLVGIPFLSVMGASAAAGVAIAIVAAITLLPALMGTMGDKLRPAPDSAASRLALAGDSKPSMGRRWVRMVMAKPLLVSLISIVGLGTLALPALSLDLNLPGGGQEPLDSTQRKAFDHISDGFGPGYNGPLLVSVDITGSDSIMDDLDALRDELATVPGIDYVSEGFPSPGLDTGIVQVIPLYAPDSKETKALVTDLRDRIPEWEASIGNPIDITGFTAIGVDLSQRIQDALIPFGLVVVGLSVLLLLAVFRSLMVPIKAALGFVLSVTAAFGVVVAIFQWGWLGSLMGVDTPGPILSFMPIILMAVLFGLAMDYEVFLVSGMRERHVHTGDWRYAIEEGYSSGARVVTSAALIMFFVFFAFVPEGSNTLKPIALGLAVGIALDAFVVRMTLVPALMALFKERAWSFPRILERAIPHADVEGEKLGEHIRDTLWARTFSESSVHAEYLVLKDHSPHATPLSLEWRPGDRLDVVGEPHRARLLAATLTGAVPQASGSLHVAGHPLPSESGRARTKVSVWSPQDADALTPLGDALRERMMWSETLRGLSAPDRRQRIRATIEQVGALCDTFAPGHTITSASIPGLLGPTQQIVVFAALALADGSPVCLVCPAEPLYDEGDRDLWWRALDTLAGPKRTVALCSLPPARALSPVSVTTTTVDVSESETVVAS